MGRPARGTASAAHPRSPRERIADRHGLHPIVVSAPQAHVAQELNLGVAFTWTAINETVDALFAARGEVRPSAPAEPELTA